MLLPQPFASSLFARVFDPSIASLALDAFDTTVRNDGLSCLAAYAAIHSHVADSRQFRVISDYQRLVAAAQRLDYPSFADALNALVCYEKIDEHDRFPGLDGLSDRIARHLNLCSIDPASQHPQTVLCLEIAAAILSDGAANLYPLYLKRADAADHEQAMGLLLSVCCPLSAADPGLAKVLTQQQSGAQNIAAAFLQGFGRGANHWLRGRLSADNPFSAHLLQALHAHKNAGGSFFAKLFGKKI